MTEGNERITGGCLVCGWDSLARGERSTQQGLPGRHPSSTSPAGRVRPGQPCEAARPQAAVRPHRSTWQHDGRARYMALHSRDRTSRSPSWRAEHYDKGQKALKDGGTPVATTYRAMLAQAVGCRSSSDSRLADPPADSAPHYGHLIHGQRIPENALLRIIYLDAASQAHAGRRSRAHLQRRVDWPLGRRRPRRRQLRTTPGRHHWMDRKGGASIPASEDSAHHPERFQDDNWRWQSSTSSMRDDRDPRTGKARWKMTFKTFTRRDTTIDI